MSALLEIRQLDKHFGGLHVLKQFNMTLQAALLDLIRDHTSEL